jgi:hypothetical protein
LVKEPGEKKKNQVKKKYSNMLDDVKKFMEEVDKMWLRRTWTR